MAEPYLVTPTQRDELIEHLTQYAKEKWPKEYGKKQATIYAHMRYAKDFIPWLVNQVATEGQVPTWLTLQPMYRDIRDELKRVLGEALEGEGPAAATGMAPASEWFKSVIGEPGGYDLTGAPISYEDYTKFLEDTQMLQAQFGQVLLESSAEDLRSLLEYMKQTGDISPYAVAFVGDALSFIGPPEGQAGLPEDYIPGQAWWGTDETGQPVFISPAGEKFVGQAALPAYERESELLSLQEIAQTTAVEAYRKNLLDDEGLRTALIDEADLSSEMADAMVNLERIRKAEPGVEFPFETTAGQLWMDVFRNRFQKGDINPVEYLTELQRLGVPKDLQEAIVSFEESRMVEKAIASPQTVIDRMIAPMTLYWPDMVSSEFSRLAAKDAARGFWEWQAANPVEPGQESEAFSRYLSEVYKTPPNEIRQQAWINVLQSDPEFSGSIPGISLKAKYTSPMMGVTGDWDISLPYLEAYQSLVAQGITHPSMSQVVEQTVTETEDFFANNPDLPTESNLLPPHFTRASLGKMPPVGAQERALAMKRTPEYQEKMAREAYESFLAGESLGLEERAALRSWFGTIYQDYQTKLGGMKHPYEVQAELGLIRRGGESKQVSREEYNRLQALYKSFQSMPNPWQAAELMGVPKEQLGPDWQKLPGFELLSGTQVQRGPERPYTQEDYPFATYLSEDINRKTIRGLLGPPPAPKVPRVRFKRG